MNNPQFVSGTNGLYAERERIKCVHQSRKICMYMLYVVVFYQRVLRELEDQPRCITCEYSNIRYAC